MGWTCEFCGKKSRDRASSRSLAVHQQFSASCLKAQGKKSKQEEGNNPDNDKGTTKVPPEDITKTLWCDECDNQITSDQAELGACPYCGEAF